MRSSQKYLDIHLAEQNKKHTFALANQQGAIAQLVEQRTENPCVPGSIPGGTTLKKSNSQQTPDFQTKSGVFVFSTYAKYGNILPCGVFLEYVAQLMEYDKKFLIVGPYNAISYKEIFPLIQSNRMWLGYGFNAGNVS